MTDNDELFDFFSLQFFSSHVPVIHLWRLNRLHIVLHWPGMTWLHQSSHSSDIDYSLHLAPISQSLLCFYSTSEFSLEHAVNHELYLQYCVFTVQNSKMWSVQGWKLRDWCSLTMAGEGGQLQINYDISQKLFDWLRLESKVLPLPFSGSPCIVWQLHTICIYSILNSQKACRNVLLSAPAPPSTSLPSESHLLSVIYKQQAPQQSLPGRWTEQMHKVSHTDPRELFFVLRG